MSDAQQKRLAPAIARELELAAETLRRLPLPRYATPSAPISSWPGIVQDSWRALAAGRTVQESRAGIRSKPASPAPAEIDAMDNVLAWLWWLDAGQRRVAWARALRISWRRLALTLACSTAQARYRHAGALRVLARRLDAQGYDVRALTAMGEAQPDWSAEEWAQARRAGITWVLQVPSAKRDVLKLPRAGEDFPSQV